MYSTHSTYLSATVPGDSIFCFVKEAKANFYMPADRKTSTIMVGPGTGVAPFRGFLYDDLETERCSGDKAPSNTLFFGCRNMREDFIYSKDWDELVEVGCGSRS